MEKKTPTDKRNRKMPAFFKKKDVLLIATLLLAAALVWAFFQLKSKGDAPVAEITVGQGSAQQTHVVPLDKDAVYHYEGNYPVELVVEDGTIRFANARCPDHDCERFGRLSKPGEWAACLPAQVVVRLPSEP